jgi:hypothetical protein
MPDKAALFAALITQLQQDLDLQTRAAHLARDEAINEESQAESKWDTRGQEAAYLAEGQAKQAAELQEAISLWSGVSSTPCPPPQPIEVGTVFLIPQKQGILRGIMGPRAGGTEFEYEGESYTVVTPTSPLGRAVMGKRAGDTVELMVGRRLQPHRIETTF